MLSWGAGFSTDRIWNRLSTQAMDQPKWRGLFSLSVSWPIRHDPSVNCELWCHWSRAKNENLKTPWTHQQFSLSLWTSVGYHHHSTSIYIRASITRLSVAILRATCWRFSYIDFRCRKRWEGHDMMNEPGKPDCCWKEAILTPWMVSYLGPCQKKWRFPKSEGYP